MAFSQVQCSCGRAHSWLDTTIVNFKHLNFPPTGRTLETHTVSLPRLEQCSRQWRHPTDSSTREICLVDTDNLINLFNPLLIAEGDSCAKKNLIRIFLPCRIDDFRQIKPLGQKADTPVNLAQTPLAVNVIAILRAIAIQSGPMHSLDNLWTIGTQQVVKFLLDPCIPSRRDVVACSLRKLQLRRKFILIIAVTVSDKRLAHEVAPANSIETAQDEEPAPH